MKLALANPSAYGALIRSMQPLVGELSPAALAVAERGIQAQVALDKISTDLAVAADMEIDSPDMLEEAQAIAGRLAAVCAAKSGVLDAERLALTEPFRAITAAINEGYGAAILHVQTARQNLNTRILAYHQEQKRLADEAARLEREKREAEARELAEKEAKAQAEARALLDQADQAAASGAAVSADVLTAEAAQKADEARTIAQEAVSVLHTRVAAAPAASAKGVRETWSAVVTDAEAFVQFVAQKAREGDKSWLAYIVVNAQAMGAKARTEKEHFNVPGMRAERSQSVATRRGAL